MDVPDRSVPLTHDESDGDANIPGSDRVVQEVVVGIDGSPQSIAAARWAADEAVARAARLRLVTAVARWANEAPECGGNAEVGIRVREEADRGLAEARAAAQKAHPTLVVGGERRSGDPVPVLVEASMTAALLVVGAHGSGSFADLVLGSVAAAVAAKAECPVVVHRPRSESTRRIVVGVGLSTDEGGLPSDSAALRFAVTEALARNSRLQLSVADPVEALVESSKQADLLVIGRGRLHRGRLPVNSVVYGVLYHAEAPVAVVHQQSVTSDVPAQTRAPAALAR